MHIGGEYPYIRPSEEDVDKEFSVDLYADEYFKKAIKDERSNHLNLLIECKYNHPDVKWIFSSHIPKSSTSLDLYTLSWSPYSEGCSSSYYGGLHFHLPACTRGIALGTGADARGITHGIYQLRYGMPNLIFQEVSEIQHEHPEVKLANSYICLVLVTNAELYVLKSGQDLESYFSASSLSDVTERVDALIVEQRRGPHLSQYCSKLFQSLVTSSRIPLDNVDRAACGLPESLAAIYRKFGHMDKLACRAI